jgi:hypothetical protein
MFRVGLLQKDDDYYLPDIYGCYERGEGPGSRAWERAFHNVKDTRPCPQIKYIGVWDTVGALGAPGLLGQVFNGKKYQYHDVSLNPCIENAYHALAIDEGRKPFKPNLWRAPPGWAGRLEQAWFPGVHSNIGGGYTPDGLANEALHWMVEKAEASGLAFDDTFLSHYTPCFNSVRHDSMTRMYRVMGAYLRPIGEYLDAGEGIHQAAIDRMKWPSCGYDPRNLEVFFGRTRQHRIYTTSRISRGAPC